MDKERSIDEINARIKSGDAVVLTSQEVCDLVRSGDCQRIREVDVVTTATRAIMSGTYAILSLPLAEPGSFVRAEKAWINGVPATAGPCPNERLGILDMIVLGTSHSRDRPWYGGGHVFRELVEGKTALIEVETSDGKSIQKEAVLGDMPFARLFATRNSFRNYVAFVNPRSEPLATIFNALPFGPGLSCATVSGCGEINPVKNDPGLETIGLGTRILLNGAKGFVIGTGTRSSISRPNLMGFADMHQMAPELMGGFVTSAGPECIGSWAVPIPVTRQSQLQSLLLLDSEISLPIMDVNIRKTIRRTNYGDVWGSSDLEMRLQPEMCINCHSCAVVPACPMKAVTFDGCRAWRNKSMCFNCGLCTSACTGGAFKGRLGAISFDDRKIPIVLRQSDRSRAVRLAQALKRQILDGSFRITEKVE
jgi:putative methanogenesis marker 16 metalloprotein